MSKITLIREANAVSATYLPYTAYKAAIALATAHNGEIGKTAEGNFKATFANEEIAEQFKSEWTEGYNAHRKADAPAPKSEPAPKAKPSKKPTAKKAKKPTASPKKAKGNAFDYSVIKGESKSDKNKALHKVLVEMGIKDSRTPEYMSVWNARPWAK